MRWAKVIAFISMRHGFFMSVMIIVTLIMIFVNKKGNEGRSSYITSWSRSTFTTPPMLFERIIHPLFSLSIPDAVPDLDNREACFVSTGRCMDSASFNPEQDVPGVHNKQ